MPGLRQFKRHFYFCPFSGRGIDIEFIGIAADIRQAHTRPEPQHPDFLRSGGIALLHSQFQIRDSLSFVGDENFYMIRIKINDSFPAAAVYKRIDLRLLHRYRYALDHSG